MSDSLPYILFFAIPFMVIYLFSWVADMTPPDTKNMYAYPDEIELNDCTTHRRSRRSHRYSTRD